MNTEEIIKIWEQVKDELKTTIPEHVYEPWVVPMAAVGFDNNIFSIHTAHAFAISVIRKTYLKEFKTAFQNVLNKDVEIDLSYNEELAKQLKKKPTKKQQEEKKSQIDVALENLSQMQSASNLNLKYQFDNFVIGENNRFAHAAAVRVAKAPAKDYNPLFIYGGSGLGKTHLMQAIGHYILFNNSKLKVRYIKTEDFLNEFINAIGKGIDKNNRMRSFRQKFRDIDVLLIDDIQFVESKLGLMEEIFHTFDSLHNNNKQIVITSDRLPKDIPTLPDRLKTRFEMGLMVDLVPPDFETRIAILKNLETESESKMDFPTLEYIAQNFSQNIRELEGAFNKIQAYASIDKTVPNLEFAKKVLGSQISRKKITIDAIVKIVCKKMSVSIEELKSPSRNQKIAHARQIAIYLIRDIMQISYEKIAEYFNKKHPTILFSYEKIKEEMVLNSSLKDLIIELKTKISV